MRPIPKRLLIHTATLYQRVNVDKWGKGELDGGQELSNIRIEPSKQIIGIRIMQRYSWLLRFSMTVATADLLMFL